MSKLLKNKQHPVIFKNLLQSRLAHEVCKNFCLFFSRQNCKKIFDGWAYSVFWFTLIRCESPILSQCNNFLVLHLTNVQDQSAVKRLIPESMGGITNILSLPDLGEALLLGDSILLPTRIKLDKPKIEPASATRQFWAEWATQTPKPDSVSKAMEGLWWQVRWELVDPLTCKVQQKGSQHSASRCQWIIE